MSNPDPQQRHYRSIRLQGWDYRTSAAYFVTICTHQREHLFDTASLAEIARAKWQTIPRQTSRVVLDEWVLMPNHLHGILILTDDTSTPSTDGRFDMHWVTQTGEVESQRFANAPTGSLGAIIGNYKAVVTRKINRTRSTPGEKVWQRGFFDRIIRDNHELERIRAYIQDNPARWAAEQDNLNLLLTKMNLRN